MPGRHAFQQQPSDDGSQRHSAAYLNENGALVIEIHDLGPVVQRAFGMSEYESSETFSIEQTAQLRETLGADLTAAIVERFSSTADFAKHCEAVGVGRGKVWNRIGD